MVCVPLVPMNSVWPSPWARRFRGREIAAGTRLVLDHNGLCKYRLEVVG